MKAPRFLTLFLVAFALISSSLSFAEELSAEQQAKLAAKVTAIQAWAASPVIVNAVSQQNAHPPAINATMTQDQWKKLSVLDPIIRAFTRNDAAAFLKTQRAPWVSEAFISDAQGCKVAFLSKTTSWSHATSAKHKQPMNGQTWQGAVELDDSSGLQQVQISVPVLENGKPIGSLVVGISISNLD